MATRKTQRVSFTLRVRPVIEGALSEQYQLKSEEDSVEELERNETSLFDEKQRWEVDGYFGRTIE